MMESMAKERSAVSERTTESAVCEFASAKGKESEATSSKSTELDRNIGECLNEKKIDIDDASADQSKFKKVEMPVFTGDDLDSWLFLAERYFQIHKLTESEKMLVLTTSFNGLALNWYHSQEGRDKFLNWSNLKER
ncbi:transposon Tf2-1 polyprotein isoform X1 [Cucumis melo var. makuwa]|uniref:Transposon Tf2-1 polyprotein isoform X1 n=1 Tax=Cucumis melo var. makuwa TaxID=1194695 RepID=A0A5A7VH18_CUCMM|nr:transposon Tf2-1 polyprotein isoform X1 [Cucumis melo var. makuwa]TYK26534.1 transposon Tf2-1 polyprotein isoform X1 [Cucumis melo var. makuwa]